MQDMRYITHDMLYRLKVLDRAAHNFDPIRGIQHAVVAQGTHDKAIKAQIIQQAIDKGLTNFSGCPSRIHFTAY